MASTSLLPDVGAGQAPITPQMGGGGNVSLLPEVPARIDAQLGGKPVKMKKIRKNKSVKVQRGGFTFTKEEKEFIEILNEINKNGINDIKINNIKKFLEDKDGIDKLTLLKTKIDDLLVKSSNNEYIKPILSHLIERINLFTNIFAGKLKNKKDDDFKKLYNEDNEDEKIIKKGLTVINILNFIDNTYDTNNKSEKYEYLMKLLKIYINTFKSAPTDKIKNKRDEINKEVEALKKELGKTSSISSRTPPPPPPSETKNVIPSSTKKTSTAPPAPAPNPNTSDNIKTLNKTNAPVRTALPAAEEDKNKVCYEELRKKLNIDSPNFQRTIEEIMKSIPVDQMSSIIRDPRYKDVRSLISQMITMKIDQFKTDLMAARGTVAAATPEQKPAETKTEEAKAKEPKPEEPKPEEPKPEEPKPEEPKPEEPKSDASPKELNYRETYKGRYSDYFEGQDSLFCGLHSLNNLFIEERERSLIPVEGTTKQVFTKESMKTLCNEMQSATTTTSYDCENPAGYYHVEVLTRAINSIPGKPFETLQQSPRTSSKLESIRSQADKIKSTLVNEIIPTVSSYIEKYGVVGRENIEEIIRNDINSIFNDNDFDLIDSPIKNENYRELIVKEYMNSGLASLGTEYQESQAKLLDPRENAKGLMREIIEDKSFIGAIIGNGRHYIAIRKIEPYVIEKRDSLNNGNKITRYACDGLVEGKCPDVDTYVETLVKRLYDEFANKSEPAKFVLLGVRATGKPGASTNKVVSISTKGGAKTRGNKRHGIRVKKTKRRVKK